MESEALTLSLMVSVTVTLPAADIVVGLTFSRTSVTSSAVAWASGENTVRRRKTSSMKSIGLRLITRPPPTMNSFIVIYYNMINKEKTV